nr:U32 family peptidase [uncultured Shuttleworthia sp.]
MRPIELLCPASSLEVLKTAVIYGANAVYIGGEAFGLRANARNFSLKEMEDGISFAHARGVKVYVTANIYAHNEDLDGVREYFRQLDQIRPDAILIADPAVFMIAREVCPGIDIHISTQANNTNWGTYNFWHSLGATRVVAARELSLAEIREIRDHIDSNLEIEAFVHGAMCMAYSGRCLLSNYMTGKDANQGECTHACRWKYSLVEEKRPGQYMPIEEDARGSYIMNSKDLCMIEHIPEMIDAGIDSLKIEGRMKTALYVATVARTYRRAIDDYLKDPGLYQKHMDWYREQIRSCTYRQYSTGFFFGKPSEEDQIYEENSYVRGATYLGQAQKIREDGTFLIEQKNKFCLGDSIEIMKPNGDNVEVTVTSITDSEGKPQESCPHPRQMIWIGVDGGTVDQYDILRRQEEAREG